MYNVLIWGCAHEYNKYYVGVKIQEIIGAIRIVGVTASTNQYKYVDGNKFLPKESLKEYKIDLVVVAAVRLAEISKTVLDCVDISEEYIVPISVFVRPDFDIHRYMKLISSPISIIANNCWGGVTYKSIGQKFRSPLINMYVKDDDYLKLLSDLRHYFACAPKFERWEWNSILERKYPICSLDNEIELYFNHYQTLEEALEKWNARVNRINWDSIFVMMWTEKCESVQEFLKLDYEKKVIFVPKDTCDIDDECIIKIDMSDEKYRGEEIWSVVNNMASGKYIDYDVFRLLEGNVNHCRVMR